MMPHYLLSNIQNAVQNGTVVYESRRVAQQIQNLNYDLQEVCKCLLNLTETDFRKTQHYMDNGKPKICDEYLFQNEFSKREGDDILIDDLYIKLRLTGNDLVVGLVSFHLEGSI